MSLELLDRFEKLAKAPFSETESFAIKLLAGIWSNARQSNSWWRSYLPPWNEVFSSNTGMNGLLAKLPVKSRTVVQDAANFSAVWLPDSSARHYGSASTSGSTGKPVRVMKHAPTYNIGVYASSLQETIWQNRDMSLPTLHLRAQKVGSEKTGILEPFSFIWDSGVNFSIRTSDNSPAQALEFIARNQIVNVFGANNFLRLLAKEQLSNPVDHSVRHFVNWAEALNPSTRELLIEAFGAKVADRYSSEELGLIGIQCPVHNHLHAVQYLNWVEIVDEDGRPCDAGQPGRVLVTSLRNFAQPLIRYELGDIAAWGEPCDAGISLPVLEPLITRQRESIILEDGRWVQPNASGCRLSKETMVTDFQVYRFRNAILVIFASRSDLTSDQRKRTEDDLQGRFRTSDPVFLERAEFTSFHMPKRKDFVNVDGELNSEDMRAWVENLIAENFSR